MVKVDEPDDDTACLMLGLKARYAQHHGVHMLDSAIQTAVHPVAPLSDRTPVAGQGG